MSKLITAHGVLWCVVSREVPDHEIFDRKVDTQFFVNRADAEELRDTLNASGRMMSSQMVRRVECRVVW